MKKKCIVLVVDDASENIDAVVGLLQGEYIVKAAKNGTKALEIATSENPPDLILLDVVMPEMDGYDVIKKLKDNEKTINIPVIFLTGLGQAQDIVKGFEMGAVDYVPKPFNFMELKARVKTHLTIKSQQDIISSQNIEHKELLHILCHDLNNTLAIPKMAIDIVEESPDIDSLDHYLEAISISVNNGIDIINLVIEMCTLEEKKISLESIILMDIFKEAETLLKKKFLDKNITLEVKIPAEIRVFAEKRSLLNSVINNLLTNAVKFSENGKTISVNAHNVNDKMVELSILDTGIGMPENIKNNIFDVTKSTSRLGVNGEKGNGFGLPIANKFVGLYGGHIEVSSVEKCQDSTNHGTEFKVFLKSG